MSAGPEIAPETLQLMPELLAKAPAGCKPLLTGPLSVIAPDQLPSTLANSSGSGTPSALRLSSSLSSSPLILVTPLVKVPFERTIVPFAAVPDAPRAVVFSTSSWPDTTVVKPL